LTGYSIVTKAFTDSNLKTASQGPKQWQTSFALKDASVQLNPVFRVLCSLIFYEVDRCLPSEGLGQLS
jgi:hypothetical protein